MRDKIITISIDAPMTFARRRFSALATIVVYTAMTVVAWAIDSTLMQWFAILLWLVVAFSIGRAVVVKDVFLSIADARKRLDEIEAEEDRA